MVSENQQHLHQYILHFQVITFQLLLYKIIKIKTDISSNMIQYTIQQQQKHKEEIQFGRRWNLCVSRTKNLKANQNHSETKAYFSVFFAFLFV